MANTSPRRKSRKNQKSRKHSGPEYGIRCASLPLHSAPRHRFHLAPAALSYRNGPLLNELSRVFTVFWGSAWQAAVNIPADDDMNYFFEILC